MVFSISFISRASIFLRSDEDDGAAGQVTPEALALQDQVRRLRIRKNDVQEPSDLPELDLTQPIKMYVTEVSLAEAMETLATVTESRWRLARDLPNHDWVGLPELSYGGEPEST